MDLSTLDYTQLLDLKAQLEREINARQTEEKANAKRQILDLVKTYGLTIEEVLSKPATASRKPVEAKYRNPDDASQTWSGRGRKPAWVQQYVDAGFKLEDLAI
ncbi:H-NS histone family protein [Crenobacter sp. SG2303]|uniref:H-NS histone family protein n=1 Tax=Crenobacter oryzisoli TaxID=3056844 RepID=A0ABT7XJX3_9NEIS|nr:MULTISPECIES: H-NS histone family protein [unclassified Crenobacter]MDN0074003.1 H-NS histone family protein [Crenobacter sp. SG2303]MDN0085445.1 H-NS histone family protein [Crenobacter sp. SG2305]